MATAPQDEWMANPIFAGRALTLHSTSTEPPVPPKPKKSVPPQVGRIIGEIGLRYRPNNEGDLEAHAQRLRLLAEDVADVPPALLETAAKRWVRESHFMPRASDLIALARSNMKEVTVGTEAGRQQLQDHCDRLNMISKGKGGWHVIEQGDKLTVAPARDGQRVPA
jgi:hypothetical protein